MRVLWLCNVIPPMIAERLGMQGSNKEGWLSGLLSRVIRDEERGIKLGLCFPCEKDGLRGEADGIAYYGFYEDTARPERYDTRLEGRLRKIVREFAPDIVHCFGTEYPHTLAMTRAFQRAGRTLIGIQGLCFVYADAYMADLPERIRRRRTLRDLLKRDDLRAQQEKFRIRGGYEKEALCGCGHVTGRTDWDREWTQAVNPAARYHFMNETLREIFYRESWEFSRCEPFSIFLSQGNYPIKGLHYMLEALPEILGAYPQAHVYVAGDEIARFSTLKEKLKISNYGKYLSELIRRKHLEGAVTFLGRLNAEEMLARYLKSHVFVSPSSIENSPNSVGEAMLLGMPVVSSDVGGVPNLLVSGREGLLYPSGDTRALTGSILTVFREEDRALAMGRAASLHARRTHDPDTNYRRLLEIYHEIELCV